MADYTTTNSSFSSPRICRPGGTGVFYGYSKWEGNVPDELRFFLALAGLFYCFIGVAIVADLFMVSIEQITSQEKTIDVDIEGKLKKFHVKVWNDTVANLTLMALGSSAPEILLSIIEIVFNDFFSGELGPATIVGSAAFNMLIIVAVCIVVIPENETRYIEDMSVFAVTSSFSVLAYLWVVVILMETTPNVVTITEASITFLYFPLLVFLAYAADRNWLPGQTGHDGHGKLARGARQIGGHGNLTAEDLAKIDGIIKEKYGLLPPEQHLMLAVAEVQKQQYKPHSRMYHRVMAVRALYGGKRKTHKAAASVASLHALDSQRQLADRPVMEVHFRLPQPLGLQWSVSGRSPHVLCRVVGLQAEGNANLQGIEMGDIITHVNGSVAARMSKRSIQQQMAKPLVFLSVQREAASSDLASPADVAGDDEHQCIVKWKSKRYTCNENDGVLRLEILREGQLDHKLTVRWATKDGSAKSGVRFVGTDRLTTFERGQKEQIVEIELIDDEIYQDDEHFTVNLLQAAAPRSFHVRVQRDPTGSLPAEVCLVLSQAGVDIVSIPTQALCQVQLPVGAPLPCAWTWSQCVNHAAAHLPRAVQASSVTAAALQQTQVPPDVPTVQGAVVRMAQVTSYGGSACSGAGTDITAMPTNADTSANSNPYAKKQYVSTSQSAANSTATAKFDDGAVFLLQFAGLGEFAFSCTNHTQATEIAKECQSLMTNRLEGELQKRSNELTELIQHFISTIDHISFSAGDSASSTGWGDRLFHPKVVNPHTAIVTVLNDDDPGIIIFADDLVMATEYDRVAKIAVLRTRGAGCPVSCRWRTKNGTAVAPHDYEAGSGLLHFGVGETEKVVEVRLMQTDDVERAEAFQVILEDPQGGCTFDHRTDGGLERCICTVHINETEGTRSRIQAMLPFLSLNADVLRLGRQNWVQQFSDAWHPHGVGGEDGKTAPPTFSDLMLHYITLPWKLTFALVPPTNLCGGWPSFITALFFIGVVTALIGDLAAITGCCIDMPEPITAITIVALGTSLPDAYASKMAATHDPYADASIGNVTGSNAVNVFLGLGMPWLIGAIYWHFNGKTDEWKGRHPDFIDLCSSGCLVVPAGTLGFSVIVFVICAVAWMMTLLFRRKFYGGELGGASAPKYATAGFMVFLWFVYVVMSSLKAKNYI